jgi:(p)ppGpp synthase/HD superfamily hydrolase
LGYPPEFLRHRERIRAWLLGRKYYKSVEALEFASDFHVGIRKDGVTPEFHHQISIAHYIRTLYNLRFPEDVLTSAFLHDVVEDYDVSPDEIEARFGYNVREAVTLLSKKYRGDKKPVEEYYRAMRTNAIASIVKGADRIHNFQTMHSVFTCTKQMKYIEECEEHILPMLKEARRNFPDQELAYENIKHALKGQIELLKLSIEAKLAVERMHWGNNQSEEVTDGKEDGNASGR